MIGTTRIQGADQYANNNSAGTYGPQLQILNTLNRRSKLHKVVVSNLGLGDVYLWVFDSTVNGLSNGLQGQRYVVLCPSGVCTTLDLTDGTPFLLGIYMAVATNSPATPSDAMTLAANNAAIIDASYRLE